MEELWYVAVNLITFFRVSWNLHEIYLIRFNIFVLFNFTGLLFNN